VELIVVRFLPRDAHSEKRGIICRRELFVCLKILHFVGILGKLEHPSTHNLLCRTFAAVSWKVSTSCAAYFCTRRRRRPKHQNRNEEIELLSTLSCWHSWNETWPYIPRAEKTPSYAVPVSDNRCAGCYF